MPDILASFSRASGRSVYLPESKSTSDILTTRPRAVSRVSRVRLNCWRRRARSSWRSRTACLTLCVGIGRGGAIQVGIDFGGLLLFLGVVAVSFGVGLGTSRLLGSGLRVTVVAIRYIAIANGFGGGGFGVEAALGFLICMGLGVSFPACSPGAFWFGPLFGHMLYGEFHGAFSRP